MASQFIAENYFAAVEFAIFKEQYFENPKCRYFVELSRQELILVNKLKESVLFSASQNFNFHGHPVFVLFLSDPVNKNSADPFSQH